MDRRMAAEVASAHMKASAGAATHPGAPAIVTSPARPQASRSHGSADVHGRTGTAARTRLRWFEVSLNRFADATALGVAMLILGAEPITLLYAVLAFVALNLNDPKHQRLTPRISEDISGIAGRLALPLLVLAPFGAFQRQSPMALSFVFVVSAGLVLLGRGIAYTSQRHLRSARVLSAPTLIVGAGPLGQTLGRILDEHPEYGSQVVGYVDSEPPAAIADRVVGSPMDLPALLSRYGIERVIVAFGAVSGSRMVPILRACDEHDVAVYHVPRFFELGVLPASTEHEDVWGMPLIRFRRAGLRRSSRFIKRGGDLMMSSVALVLATPLLLLLALAVRFTSSGPVLFRQVRIGQDGKEFELLKFRTMEQNDDSAVRWSVVGDKRLTSVGRFLRSTSLDEIPQLINILRGDMSIVGPRPERPIFVERFGAELPGYHARHRMPVGLTGWSQVHGLRGDTSIEERIRLDNYYIENWSLWLDFVIILRTFRSLRTAA